MRSLFSRPATSVIRGVHLYVSTGSVIVAALHQNLDGIYYEQSVPLVVPGRPGPAQLGNAFRSGFEAFSVQDRSLVDAKRSDWPAFRVSGLRSLKEFGKLFRPMHCYGLNASNTVVRATMAHPTEEGIELSVSFNPLLGPEAIGGKLLQLANAALAT